jgi:hypothetical protein
MSVYKCPVCEGRGIVKCGFYSVPFGFPISTNNVSQEICRSCSGSGLVYDMLSKEHDSTIEYCKCNNNIGTSDFVQQACEMCGQYWCGSSIPKRTICSKCSVKFNLCSICLKYKKQDTN